MSWLSGYTSKPSTSADSRQSRRETLEAERLQRSKKRAELKKQLQEAQQSREEANQAIQDLLDLAPDIFDETSESIAGQVVDENILNDDSEVSIVMDFDAENGTDGKSALSDLKGVQCPFIQEDIEFWFGQLEAQLEVIEVKSQWMKRIALQRFLPPEIQEEVKGLLSLGKTAAGGDIYFKIKNELIELFGRKPEDSYTRAKERVLTGKPSQLGKALLNDLCKKDKKLDGCCCSDITWGMFREKLPIVVRNHLAESPFNKDTYKAVFTKADQVWDSNRASEPVLTRPVAAMSGDSKKASQTSSQNEVAAVQRGQNGQGGKKDKNKNKNQNQAQNTNQNPPKESNTKKGVNEENLCRMHAKWQKEANFCSAPWACKMKNFFKAPQ